MATYRFFVKMTFPLVQRMIDPDAVSWDLKVNFFDQQLPNYPVEINRCEFVPREEADGALPLVIIATCCVDENKQAFVSSYWQCRFWLWIWENYGDALQSLDEISVETKSWDSIRWWAMMQQLDINSYVHQN